MDLRLRGLTTTNLAGLMSIPLSISVYEHAAGLIGRSPWDVSRNFELLLDAHSKAYSLYRHFPAIIGIDIYNLEAEAYGCTVAEPEGNGIPSITIPLFSSIDDALGMRPFDPATAGRIPMVIDVAVRLKDRFPEADVRIPLSGPFSIAQNLIGLNELLMAVALEPEKVCAMLKCLVSGQIAFSRAVKNAGIGVAFFESAASPPLISPSQFQEIELPALKEIIEGVSAIFKSPVPCIIGGDTEKILPEIIQTGTKFVICPAETDRKAFLEKVSAHPDVTVRINLAQAIYSSGDRKRIRDEIDSISALAQKYPNKILLGTGAVPYETDTETILFIMEYCSYGFSKK